jgi:hypothetical protein
MKLSAADLSFVVQGPVIPITAGAQHAYSTKQVLASIRKYFPESQIVLSTWQGANTGGLDYDLLVLNDDPGPLTINDKDYNVNRLIKSTVNGLKNCLNDYVVKTRTDIAFTSNELLAETAGMVPVKGRYKLFQHKVLSTNFYVRDPLKSNILFHPSDILLIGKKDDLLLFFDHELATFNDFNIGGDESFYNKVVNEQYLLLKTIQAICSINVAFNKYWEYKGIKNLVRSEQFIFRNFHLKTNGQLGVEFSEKLSSALSHQNYSERALKWFPVLKSNIITDWLFFNAIRGTRYYLKNRERNYRLQYYYNAGLRILKWKS